MGGCSENAVRRTNGCGEPVDLFQLQDPTASSVRSVHVHAFRASCPDCSFSIELGDTEINIDIRGVLALGADLNLGSGLIPQRERVDSLWVSLPGLAFSYLCQPPFLDVSMFLRRVSSTLMVPHRWSPYLRML
jgi:hypothetical protein